MARAASRQWRASLVTLPAPSHAHVPPRIAPRHAARPAVAVAWITLAITLHAAVAAGLLAPWRTSDSLDRPPELTVALTFETAEPPPPAPAPAAVPDPPAIATPPVADPPAPATPVAEPVPTPAARPVPRPAAPRPSPAPHLATPPPIRQALVAPALSSPAVAPPASAPVVAPTLVGEISGACRAPAYPPAAERAGERGRVTVRALVAADGTPTAVNVVSSSGSARLDKAAMDGMRACRYRPATQDGKPVSGAAERSYSFAPADD